MLTRRRVISQAIAGCVVTAGLGSWRATPAHATTARVISLPQLVGITQHTVVGTPVDSHSLWETLGDAQRIVTYVRIDVAQSIDGRPPATRSILVRTLGGRVGDIGQLVHGEARLTLEKPAVLFLQSSSNGVLSVAAMAQGHFPLKSDENRVSRLTLSPDMPYLLKNAASAAGQLVSKTVVEAEDIVCRCLVGAE